MTPEKTVDNKVIEKQLVNNMEGPTTSNNDVEPLARDIDQPDDWKKIKNTGCFERFASTTAFFKK